MPGGKQNHFPARGVDLQHRPGNDRRLSSGNPQFNRMARPWIGDGTYAAALADYPHIPDLTLINGAGNQKVSASQKVAK